MSDKYYTLMPKGTVAMKTQTLAISTKAIGPRVFPMVRANKFTKMGILTKDKSCMEKSLALESTDSMMEESIKGVFTIIKVTAEEKSATPITAHTKENGS